jgi:glycosyltransferase involved in cell wall biosynthesis
LLSPGTGGEYLAFLGRIARDKGPEVAIEAACRAGIPIKIAAKIGDKDRDFYEDVVKPMLRHPLVEYIGEINENEKLAFLGNAKALLFPICWPEPFGMVMIEAMACGTPVIAFPYGSVPEIVEPDVNGMIVRSVEQMVDAIQTIDQISRADVRKSFEARFTVERMVGDYLKVYRRLVDYPNDSVRSNKQVFRQEFGR